MRECFDACVDIILSESCALYAEACRSKVRLSVLSLFTPGWLVPVRGDRRGSSYVISGLIWAVLESLMCECFDAYVFLNLSDRCAC
jgi:hypothetical protein